MSSAAVATALAVNLPLLYIFARSLEGGLRSPWLAFRAADGAALLSRTLALTAGVVALGTAIAVPLAWLVTRTDLPGRRAWAVVAALPLVFPSYVAAFSFVAVLGPRGYLQRSLSGFGVERLPDLAYGFSGALLVLGLFTYPYVYLPLVAALRAVDPALEEASRNLGRGRWMTFWAVVLPQLRHPLYGGGLLMALYALSDFGAVSIVRYNTFTLAIFNAYRALFDRAVAATLAAVLVLLAIALLLLENRLTRSVRPHRTRSARPAAPVELGRWKLPALVSFGAVAALTVGLPVITVVGWGATAIAAGNPLGSAGVAAANSLGVAIVTALLAVVLALPLALWAVRFPSPLPILCERLARAGFALPGLVVALSLVFFAVRYARPLYQTPALLVAAYLVRFLPEAIGAAHGAVAALSPRFEEAARSLGRGSWSVLRTLTVPLIRPGLLAGAGLVFLTTMKELPATLILRPAGFDTLATRIWTAASEGIYSQAAVPALWLLALSALPVYFLAIRPALAEGSGASVGARGGAVS